MKTNKFFYICDNVEQPLYDSEEVYDLEMPIYEDVNLGSEINRLGLYGDMESLMSYYSFYGEIVCCSLEKSSFNKYLINVSSVHIDVMEDEIAIKYVFENGQEYIPARNINIVEEDLTKEEIDILIEMANKASNYMHFVGIPIQSNNFSFESESWG